MGELKGFSAVAPFLTNPFVLAGLVLLLIASLHRTLIASGIIKPIPQKSGLSLLRSLLRYSFFLGLLAILLGFTLEFRRQSGNSVYRVRVVVLNERGSPVDEANLTSSLGGEIHKGSAYWQIILPRSSGLTNSRLTVYAEKPDLFLKGTGSIVLEEVETLSLTIRLAREEVAVSGVVVDELGRSIEGASVSVVGHRESVSTTDSGHFELPAHAARDQPMLLRVEKDGYQSTMQRHLAGSPATLVLQRQ